MRSALVLLKAMVTLLGVWVASFVVLMLCFALLMWVHARLSGPRDQRRRRHLY